ncbi:MAG: hypothetical protein M1833_001350 [Piccolia ochrophora]|nr:MAG: hypothetical protein M1833_001350 [Piccolia ochrophora]
MNVLDDASSILLAGKVAAESPRSKPFVHFQDPRAAAAAHTLFNRAFFSLPIAQQGPHIEVFCGEPVGTSKKCGVTKSDNNVWAYSNLKPSATAGGERAWDVILCPSTFKLPRSPLPCSKPITGFTPGTTSSAWALVTQLLYIYQSILDPDIPSGQLMGGFKDTAAACVDVRRFTGGSPSTTELTKAGRGLSPIQRAVCLARVAAWSADLGLVEDPDRYTGPPCLQNFFSGNFDDSELPRYMKASTY